jgi:hypothetical protein
VLRSSEQTRFSSASDDEVGGSQRDRASGASKSERHVGLDGIGSLDAASGQALRDKEGEFE